jgi:hypothetical protein
MIDTCEKMWNAAENSGTTIGSPAGEKLAGYFSVKPRENVFYLYSV